MIKYLKSPQSGQTKGCLCSILLIHYIHILVIYYHLFSGVLFYVEQSFNRKKEIYTAFSKEKPRAAETNKRFRSGKKRLQRNSSYSGFVIPKLYRRICNPTPLN
ncbi:hypothetical protein, partial [Fulvivirga marina]|uniref:hypothetical protein n=1 Tax=Fulvivirga marina TaxID=2494733 RepID=UPI001EE374ED